MNWIAIGILGLIIFVLLAHVVFMVVAPRSLIEKACHDKGYFSSDDSGEGNSDGI